MARLNIHRSISGILSGRIKREQQLGELERELIVAEGNAANPFGGNPEATRRRRAAGQSFVPVRGTVSDEAQALAEGDVDSAKRKRAKKALAKDVARENRPFVRRGRSIFSRPSAESRSIMSTGASSNVPGAKIKLGV